MVAGDSEYITQAWPGQMNARIRIAPAAHVNYRIHMVLMKGAIHHSSLPEAPVNTHVRSGLSRFRL